MRHEKIPSYAEGQMVVVRIENRKGETEWLVGMIVRGTGDGYLVRVALPLEYRRPIYEEPKRRWIVTARDDKYSEREHHFLWSGWVELPRDPSFVLFSRIASSTFLKDIRERLGGKDISSETVREYRVSAAQVFPVNRQELYREIFA